MINELVAASAWIRPASGPPPPALPPPPPPPGPPKVDVVVPVVKPGPPCAPPGWPVPPLCGDRPLVACVCGVYDGSELIIARSSGASRVASALRRYTTL